jgi:hypothetical protein
MLYVTDSLKNSNIVYNSNTVYHFKNYIGFQSYAVSNLTNLAFKFFEKITKCHLNFNTFKSKRKKFYNSQVRFWLNDFYVDSKDFSTKYSSTMIQCSKISRLNSTNFKL